MPPPASAASAPAPLGPGVRRPGLRALRSDEALARRAGAGDHEAFAVLYARYAPRLESYCRSIVRNDEDARDALQSTMTNAWLALCRRHREIVVRPWLYRIAHNEAVTVLRRRRPAGELSELVPDAGPGPHARALVREDLGATVASIRALPDRLAQPLLLRELSGLSYAEVGAVLGTAPDDARKAVFEARSALTVDRAARAEDCAAIRETLSDGDGRRRRARRVRSHLRGCAPCREWDRVQRDRRDRLAAFPLGAVPAGGLWAWLAGAVGAGTAGGGAVVSGTIGANVKAAAAVAVIAMGAPPAVRDVEPQRVRRPAAVTAGAGPAAARATAPADGSGRSRPVRRPGLLRVVRPGVVLRPGGALRPGGGRRAGLRVAVGAVVAPVAPAARARGLAGGAGRVGGAGRAGARARRAARTGVVGGGGAAALRAGGGPGAGAGSAPAARERGARAGEGERAGRDDGDQRSGGSDHDVTPRVG